MTPELDLTPEEINDPEMMQLWVAPYGTALPSSWDGPIDMAFRFAGMVERDAKAHFRGRDQGDVYDTGRDRGPAAMALAWRRLLRKHAEALEVGSYCSALFGVPAERVLGVAPRVAFRGFDVCLAGGASCTAVLEIAEAGQASLHWYAGPKVFA